MSREVVCREGDSRERESGVLQEDYESILVQQTDSTQYPACVKCKRRHGASLENRGGLLAF